MLRDRLEVSFVCLKFLGYLICPDFGFWRAEGASRSIYCGGKLPKNAANDCNCLFPTVGWIVFCICAVT